MQTITITLPQFADGVVPTGLVDGQNAIYTLPQGPNPAKSLILTRNGVVMKQGTGGDYTLTGAQVTFVAASIPSSGDLLQAWYRY